MHHGYEKLLNGQFLTITNAFIAHLRQQTNLIIDMKATCPKLSNRWVVMGNVCAWMLEKRVRLMRYISENQPSQAPPTWWWIVVAGIDALTTQVNIVFTKLQGKDITVGQQNGELNNLRKEICKLGIQGPHSTEEVAIIDRTTHFVSDKGWSVTRYNILRYLFDQGLFVRELFRELESQMQFDIVSATCQLTFDIVGGVDRIQAERNSNNLPGESLPPTMPHELVHIQGAEFGDILLTQMN
jgi:hypothetical protein